MPSTSVLPAGLVLTAGLADGAGLPVYRLRPQAQVVPIPAIQGRCHYSPLAGQRVRSTGGHHLNADFPARPGATDHDPVVARVRW